MPKYLTTKSGRKVVLNTPEEDAAITAAALSDPDAQPLTDGDMAKMKLVRRPGRPAGSGTKVQLTVRFDADVVDEFRKTGDGWQTRMNDALRDWLAGRHAA